MTSWKGVWRWALCALALSGCVDLSRPNGRSRVGSVDAVSGSDAGFGGNVPTPAMRSDGGAGGSGPPDAMMSVDLWPDLRPDTSDALVPGGHSVGGSGGSGPLVVDASSPPDVPNSSPTKLALGAACSSGSVCMSGFCSDGVCCDGVCGSLCQSCRLAGQEGRCQPVTAGADPDNECGETSVQSCGNDGTCNGAGACRLRAAGTVCGSASCTGGTQNAAPTCNGSGQCAAGSGRNCAPYVCSAAACGSSCQTSVDCASGNLCSKDACVPSSAVVVADDFSDGNVTTTTMGGYVDWDNLNVNQVNGELRFSWNGTGVFQDLLVSFRADFCAYDLRPFRTLRFRMRSSAGSKAVRVLMGLSNGTCGTDSNPQITSITVTPTMTWFDVDITTVVRDKSLFFELTGNTDATEYFLDDVHLVR
jgi:hypothetical protein